VLDVVSCRSSADSTNSVGGRRCSKLRIGFRSSVWGNAQGGSSCGRPIALAAFSDGVIAIIITIMVLEVHVPHGADWAALTSVAPNLLTYVLSFVYIAIYWNNHHHLLHTVARVDGLILWANSHLLFWLSALPVATAWMGQHLLTPLPTAVYGVALLMPAIAYYLLVRAIIHQHGEHWRKRSVPISRARYR